jgi:hypothetical protein
VLVDGAHETDVVSARVANDSVNAGQIESVQAAQADHRLRIDQRHNASRPDRGRYRKRMRDQLEVLSTRRS